MNIDKAIKILTRAHNFRDVPFGPDLDDAQELGIEALKRVKEDKLKYFYPECYNLPGETEEVK